MIEFTDREQQEIEFARFYANRFDHGTSGHLAYTVIAKQAEMVEQLQGQVNLLEVQSAAPSPATRKFLGALFDQMRSLAEPIKDTGADCHFDLTSHILSGEIVITVTPVAVPKRDSHAD